MGNELKSEVSADLILITARITNVLYDQQKAVNDRRRWCSMHGRNFNVDSEGLQTALLFRHTLSFARLILNENKFFEDQINGEI